ncbi:PREDICTED: splicing factor 3A subunit 1-like [Dufourea novaeangliae]|uniref:splicing factor 3A subunit 1-like n=1 Tax=Dufourea novaeangliae TaxID=178035 RepID=UPI0007679EFF|nr:PREDICTED: splicing factor 3A subunit 1-like [Dufourea novaeangliae]
MERNLEQRIVIKFLVKNGESSTEIYEKLSRVYGNNTMSKPRVFDWAKRFREGRESVEDAERSGRPSTTRQDENIARVRDLVRSDKRLTTRMIAEKLNINRESVRLILTENLLMTKIGLKHTTEPTEEESQTKKLRTEDSLIPEQQFLARNKGPVQLSIAVPMMAEKAEWKLHGQILNITLQGSDTVATMKALIHKQTGMPPGKQKLQYEGMFFNDSNTLAYYNVTSDNIINLLLKEKGSRKK